MPGEAHQAPFIHLLEELRDPTAPLPVSSHRPAPVGPAIVFAKRALHRVMGPLIGVALRKQSLFNQNVVSFAQAIFRDVKSLESAMWGIRGERDERIARLEEAVAALQTQVSNRAAGAGRGSQSGVPTNGSAKPNA